MLQRFCILDWLLTLLFRGQYVEDVVDTSISSVRLGTAVVADRGLGRAVLVEQCRCPKGYTGLSCEVRL